MGEERRQVAMKMLSEFIDQLLQIYEKSGDVPVISDDPGYKVDIEVSTLVTHEGKVTEVVINTVPEEEDYNADDD